MRFICAIFLACLTVVSATYADTVTYQLRNYTTSIEPVYKGELITSLVGAKHEVQIGAELVRTQGMPYTLQLRYRSNTKDVVRILVTELTLVNANSGEVLNFPEKYQVHSGVMDADGHWIIDIEYPRLALDYEDYTLHALVTLGLNDSLREHDIRTYLKRNFQTSP